MHWQITTPTLASDNQIKANPSSLLTWRKNRTPHSAEFSKQIHRYGASWRHCPERGTAALSVWGHLVALYWWNSPFLSQNPYHIERLGVVSAFALHNLPRLTPYDYRKEGLPHTRRNSQSGTATAGDSGDCQVNWPYTNLAGAAWGWLRSPAWTYLES